MRERCLRSVVFFVFLLLALAAPGAHATDGYFPHGYGMVAKGMGGVSTAVCTDAMAGATNPAKLAMAGTRLDVGAELFAPRRSVDRTGNVFGLNGSATSGSLWFAVPEFGYARELSPRLSIGVTMYGNGGMNTNFPGGQIPAGFCGPGAPSGNLLCGAGSLGVDLSQLIVAPTVAVELAPGHAVGVSALVGYQRFKVEGLQAFTGLSIDGASVTNNDYDSSFGFGVRVGYFGQLGDRVAVGAAVSPRMAMGEFDKYRGLFAEEGAFDIPTNFNVGVALTPTPDLTVAADVQRILYSGVKAVGNASLSFSPLGSEGGPGFGWRDVTVVRMGAQYALSDRLTLRGGFNHGQNPISEADVTLNILAPGVIENHLTAGASLGLGAAGTLHLAYMHAFENEVVGATSPLFPGGGQDAIRMHQNSLGFAFSRRF